MSEINRAIKGTNDILPEEIHNWQFVEGKMLETARLFGFEEIRVPVFEHTEVFTKSVGDTTDVVQKEMYTFLQMLILLSWEINWYFIMIDCINEN